MDAEVNLKAYHAEITLPPFVPAQAGTQSYIATSPVFIEELGARLRGDERKD